MIHPALRGAELALKDAAMDLQHEAESFDHPFDVDDIKAVDDAILNWQATRDHYIEMRKQHEKEE